MLVHSSSAACDLLWIYFMCCITLVRCVLVLRFGSAGVVWYPYASWSTTCKLLKMDIVTFEICWVVNSEIIKQVTSSWSVFIQLSSFSLHKDTTPPQPNHTLTPTHIEPEQYNTWNNSTIIRKLLKMDVLTFETCWAVNGEIIKQVTSSWSVFIQMSSNDLGILRHFRFSQWLFCRSLGKILL